MINLLKIFSYSNSFPGDNIVLLKKKSFNLKYKINQKNFRESLKKFGKYTFGIVRGLTVSDDFDNAGF